MNSKQTRMCGACNKFREEARITAPTSNKLTTLCCHQQILSLNGAVPVYVNQSAYIYIYIWLILFPYFKLL